ncbi:MAG TPA: tetratricopeptide repeat protein [Saprospiraceae bacterium]|nr:tetratricopeptide repeat protein [Saprospiraceae bacterium]HND86863.1 tetratricopeptide repeat protein [Saprospiraceae bacterium]HNG88685.1 tetratricopeptide repeat protein [Saprospiraceae bacterium]
MAKRKVAPETNEAEVVYQEVNQPASFNLQHFLDNNHNLILYVLGGVALLILGWWGYKKMVVEPKQREAVAAMWQAELMFERDSFKLALENPGAEAEGFQSLADRYSGTAAGNTAAYCAGICYLHTGDFDNAIKYLGDCSPSSELMAAVRNGALGDAYSEKKDFGKALDYYEKAVNASRNDVLATYYLKKLGMLNEYQGNKEAALKAYDRIRRDYPNQQSQDWREVEKYIYRAGAK